MRAALTLCFRLACPRLCSTRTLTRFPNYATLLCIMYRFSNHHCNPSDPPALAAPPSPPSGLNTDSGGGTGGSSGGGGSSDSGMTVATVVIICVFSVLILALLVALAMWAFAVRREVRGMRRDSVGDARVVDVWLRVCVGGDVWGCGLGLGLGCAEALGGRRHVIWAAWNDTAFLRWKGERQARALFLKARHSAYGRRQPWCA